MENAVKDDGWTRMEWQRGGMGGKVRKHALLQLGKASVGVGPLSETAYIRGGQGEENVSHFSRNDVWRQFYCAFHSVGRFEIQARILLCPRRGGRKVRLRGYSKRGDV